MLLNTFKTNSGLKKLLLRAAKMPAVLVLMGLSFAAMSYIDNVFTLTQWKPIFDLSDKIGTIFFALAAATFIYKILVISCRMSEKKLVENHAVASLILTSLRKGLRVIYFLAVINIIITIAGPSKFYLVLANSLLDIMIISSIGWVAVQVFYTFEAILYQHMMSLSRHEHIRAKALYTKMHIIRNITTVVIVVITIAAILMSFSSVRNIGISLLASAGFLTAIVGLSAQKTLFTLFSGLQIALSQEIKIGDIVVIDNVSGIIEEITFTYVTLKLGDRRRLVVPIHYFVDKAFENWSREADGLRSSFYLYVDYLLPIPPVREELNRILKASSYWDGNASKLQVSNLTERCVELRVQVSAANADDISDLRAEVREKLLEYIRNHFPNFLPKVRMVQNGNDENLALIDKDSAASS